MKKLMLLLVGAGLASSAFAASAAAAPIVVDTDSDASAAGPPCTLREALDNANSDNAAPTNGCTAGSGADAISFDPAVTAPAGPQTIDLGAGMGVQLLLNSSLTLTGPGSSELIIDGADTRTLYVGVGPVTVSGLTVTGGSLVGTGILLGAGIYNDGASLTLNQVTVSGNQLQSSANLGQTTFVEGAGIYSTGSGTLTLDQSTVENNTATASNSQGDIQGAQASGAGIASYGALSIHRSVIDDNQATATDALGAVSTVQAFGAGIRSATDFLDIDRSQITNNDASASALTMGSTAIARGAGFADGSSVDGRIEETTIAENQTSASVTGGGTLLSYGAGVYNAGATLGLFSTTIARNGPGTGDSTAANLGNEGGATTLENTIVSDPRGAGSTNCSAAVSTAGSNVDFSAAGADCSLGAGELTTNPMLDPAGLAANGGFTETIALMPGSPAIDAGSNAGQAPAFLNQDQRGFLRPVDFSGLANAAGGNGTDIGAFEVQTTCSGQSLPAVACPGPVVNPPAPAVPGATGQRAAALKKCKKKKKGAARKKCKKKALKLPL